MYRVSFDVGRFQRKEKGSKRRTEAHATETIRHDRRMSITGNDYPLGSATYDMLKMDPYCQASIDAFASKWRVIDFPLRSRGKIPSSKVVSEGLSAHLEFERAKIRIAVRSWLLVGEYSAQQTHLPLSDEDDKNNSGQTRDIIPFDGMLPSERFTSTLVGERILTRMNLTSIYRMSKRTWDRQQARLQTLKEEEAICGNYQIRTRNGRNKI